MRTLLIGGLAATLIGCSCYIPPPPLAEMDECPLSKGFACLDRMSAVPPSAIKPAPTRVSATSTMKAKPAIASKSNIPLPHTANNRTDHVADLAKPSTVAKVEAPVPAQPAATSDVVINKAKATIAAKMEDPTSAEFADMKRAMRKNTFGQPVDTICGHVKGKNASGADTGERPFLYLVKDDDAYVVDGKAESAAAIAYRNLCN
jgi:hypothetical protein